MKTGRLIGVAVSRLVGLLFMAVRTTLDRHRRLTRVAHEQRQSSCAQRQENRILDPTILSKFGRASNLAGEYSALGADAEHQIPVLAVLRYESGAWTHQRCYGLTKQSLKVNAPRE
jgi:hypothetical protein